MNLLDMKLIDPNPGPFSYKEKGSLSVPYPTMGQDGFSPLPLGEG